MRLFLRHPPRRAPVAGSVCALALVGCQPLQHAFQPATPVAAAPPVLQPVAPPIFAAPPAMSTEGVPLDPFEANPSVVSQAVVPMAPAAPGAPLVPAPGTAAVVPALPVDGGSSRILIPVSNRDWAWEQIVDVVDDYFRIDRERPVQVVGDVVTEGRIDVFPQIGATIPELHRHDSVGRYNRWESTLQTIRRRAAVRVIPDAAGWVVDITVEKDLEDLPRPELATAGAATFRFDNSIPGPEYEPVSHTLLAGRWILLGRDPLLEQRMLGDIQARLAPQPAASFVSP